MSVHAPMRAGSVLRAAVRMGPHAEAHWAALRAFVAMAVPLMLLWRLGHPELLQYAAIGAFASLYGRHQPARSRLRMQAEMGAVLTLGVGLGVLIATSPERLWILAPAAAVWAGVVVLVSESCGWQPAGALNPVFAMAASATVPADLARLPQAVLACAAAALFTVLLATVAAAWEGDGHTPVARRGLAELPAELVRRHVARYVLGIGAAGLFVALTRVGHPYWTFVTASVPMSAPDLHGRVVRAVQRVAGTAAGLVVSVGVLWWHPTGYVAMLTLALLQGLTELSTMRNYSLGLVFFTPMALLLSDIMLPASTGALVGQRTLETAVGLALALVATALTRERPDPPPLGSDA